MPFCMPVFHVSYFINNKIKQMDTQVELMTWTQKNKLKFWVATSL